MKEISETNNKPTLRRCKSLDLSKTSTQHNDNNQRINDLQEVLVHALSEAQQENKKLQEQLKQALTTDNFEMQGNNPEFKKIQDKLQEMTSIEFYKKLENQYQDEIDELYKKGARPEDIIITEDGFGLNDREHNKLEDAKIINHIHDLESTNIRLAKFNGRSIDDIIKHGNARHLDALTDLTVHYFTQSEKKAITISDDEQLAMIWHKVRDIYQQAKLGNKTREAMHLMRYIERYRLKHIASEKIDSHLSYALRPSHRTRFLKQKMVEITEQEEARKRHLEEKYGTHKSDTKKVQETKLNGSRGKEQERLKLIIDLKKKIDSTKLEIVKGNLSYKKVIDEKRKLLDEARNLLEKCGHKPTRRSLKILLDKVSDSYNDYSHEHEHRILSGMSSHLTELKQVDLPKLEERLQKNIRKYGNTPLRNALNDICSDAGFLVTVAGTAVSWFHTVPFVAI